MAFGRRAVRNAVHQGLLRLNGDKPDEPPCLRGGERSRGGGGGKKRRNKKKTGGRPAVDRHQVFKTRDFLLRRTMCTSGQAGMRACGHGVTTHPRPSSQQILSEFPKTKRGVRHQQSVLCRAPTGKLVSSTVRQATRNTLAETSAALSQTKEVGLTRDGPGQSYPPKQIANGASDNEEPGSRTEKTGYVPQGQPARHWQKPNEWAQPPPYPCTRPQEILIPVHKKYKYALPGCKRKHFQRRPHTHSPQTRTRAKN